MSRRLQLAAIFILLGAVSNVMLAIGIVWFGRVMEADCHVHAYHETGFERQDSFGFTLVSWQAFAATPYRATSGRLPAWSRLRAIPRPYPEPLQYAPTGTLGWRFEFAAGWPMRSLKYEYEHALNWVLWNDFHLRDGIELPARTLSYLDRPQPPKAPLWRSQPRAIPTSIIPSGFMTNTLLFAVLTALAWHAPSAIRRIHRCRDNQCPKCGYSRAGLAARAPCPECGPR